MNKMTAMSRPAGRFCCFLAMILVAATGLRAADTPPSTTQIRDVVYRADGTPESGTLVISWPSFETADHKTVAAGTLGVKLAAGGAVSVSLAPNQDATPAGTYYKVVAKLDEKTVLADLAELKAHMRSLVGNGQPGRVRLLEERLDRHEAALQRAKALLILLIPALTAMHLILHFAARH